MFFRSNVARCSFIVYQTARMGLPRGLSRPNCSGYPPVAESLLSGQTRSKHFESSYCLFLSFLLSFFSTLLVPYCSKLFFVLTWSLLESVLDLQDDHPNLKNLDFSEGMHCFLKKQSTFYLSRWSWERFGGLLGSFWVLLGVSWATFGGSWGSLRRPSGASDRAQTGDTH